MTEPGTEATTPRRTLRRTLVLGATVGALALGMGACGDDDEGGNGGATTDEPAATQTQTQTQTETQGGGGAPAGDPGAGEEVFASNCASCHGSDGTGATGPDLTQAQYAGATDRVRQQVLDGGGGMPAFGDQLSDAEVDDVVAFVTKQLARR